jgi:hypothetical protein
MWRTKRSTGAAECAGFEISVNRRRPLNRNVELNRFASLELFLEWVTSD